MSAAAASLIESLGRSVWLRGETYAKQGRVEVTTRSGAILTATVLGSQAYQVAINWSDPDDVATSCTCPAFDGRGCKHVAAACCALMASAKASPRPQRPAPVINLQDLLLHYSGHDVVRRLAVYGPMPAELTKYFHSYRPALSPAAQAYVRATTPLIQQAASAIIAYRPDLQAVPTSMRPLVTRLADVYQRGVGELHFGSAVPVPMDERAGWVFRLTDTAIIVSAKPAYRVTLKVFLEAPNENVWDPAHVAALGALLQALTSATPIARSVQEFFETPRWQHFLAKFTAPDAPTEVGFEIHVNPHAFNVHAVARARLKSGRLGHWKKLALASVFDTAGATAADHEIAALLGSDLDYALPRRHALLQRLAEHPRAFVDARADRTARIVTGDIALRLTPELAETRAELTFDGGALTDLELLHVEQSGYLLKAAPGVIYSARLPAVLRPWVAEIRRQRGQKLAFPVEALPTLRAAVRPHAQVGIAHVADDFFGVQVDYAPRVGLALEWGEATRVSLLIEVAPGAPLIRLGVGNATFGFTQNDRSVWVTRDHAVELALAAEARAVLAPWVDFDDADVGSTSNWEQAAALAEWIEAPTLPVRIEIKSGKRPRSQKWAAVDLRIAVRQEGAWFALQGEARVAQHALPLGDLLAAIRRAQRFVAIGDAHVQLADEIRAMLLPLAYVATEGKGGELALHEGLGAALMAAEPALRGDPTPDWTAATQRLANMKDVRLAPARIEQGDLRPYQQVGADWMLRLASWAPGCVLADDMGLGKTVQTAALLLARKKAGPALIVTPASVAYNWQAELARFAPSLRVTLWPERAADIARLRGGDVIVASYGIVQRRTDELARSWGTVVLDEVQYLKNAQAKRTGAIRGLQRDFTVALSGTPIENHVGELWSVVSLAFPGLLGEAATFRERFGAADTEADAMRALRTVLSPFILRRTRAEVLTELPSRQDIDWFVDLSEAEQKRYEALRRACELQFGQRDERLTVAQQRIQILAAITRLRQLACDVQLVDANFTGGSSKLDQLETLCAEIFANCGATLVFSQFTTLLKKARDRLVAQGLRVEYLDGATPAKQRQAAIAAFMAGDADVFCISLKAGGTGLNLTRANFVIHLDPWWNPAVEEQANSRAYRMGQTNPVTTYRLIARGTIEEMILSLHKEKKQLADAVLSGTGTAKQLGVAEFLALVGPPNSSTVRADDRSDS